MSVKPLPVGHYLQPHDKRPSTPGKIKRYLRALRRTPVADDRYPETDRAEKLVTLHKARTRRRARNRVAKQSRKRNR